MKLKAREGANLSNDLSLKNQIRKIGIKLGIKQHFLPLYELITKPKTTKRLKQYDPQNDSYGLNTEKRDFDITVSFTTFPARIGFAVYVADAMLKQTLKPDRVILVLAEEEFSSLNDLPDDYRQLEKRGLSIVFTENLKPHKKYQYTMQNFPDSIVITVDDDLLYPEDLIETLIKSYKEHPKAVSAMRAHRMIFNDRKILPYNDWGIESTYTYEPVYDLVATGVGGVLYPAGCMTDRKDQLLDVNAIKEVCPNCDDIWLKMFELLCDVPVVLASKKKQDFLIVPGSQKNSLQSINVDDNGNDISLRSVMGFLNMSDEELYDKACRQV